MHLHSPISIINLIEHVHIASRMLVINNERVYVIHFHSASSVVSVTQAKPLESHCLQGTQVFCESQTVLLVVSTVQLKIPISQVIVP